jgi:hypothetical protein
MRGFFLRLGLRSFQCFSRQSSKDSLSTEAGRLEGEGPICKNNNNKNWISSLLVSILTVNYAMRSSIPVL